MIDKTQNPAEIYLVPVFDGDHDHVWCDTPAPGEGMREEDATRYVRADLVPASNEVLARRVVELTNERDAALEMFDNLQSDNCQLKAQVYHIRNIIENERDIIPKLYDVLNSIPARHPDDKAVDRFAAAMKTKLAAARAKGRSGWDVKASCSGEYLAQLLIEHLTKGNAGTFEDIANFAMMLHQREEDPQLMRTALALRDAEIKAQAVDALKFPTMLRKMWSGGEVQEWIKEEAKLIRQQVKGGE